ncbi:MAG: hypothetical protein ACXWXH_11365 [Aeromicrobium sp.]
MDKAEPFLSVTGHSMRMDWVAILAIMALSNSLAGPATDQLPAMLDGFDQVRSLAFETGRADAFELVYPEASPLLMDDQELLASYIRRGVDIERMRMTVLEVDVVQATARHATMRVTDQLTEARIRLSDGTVRDLPRDQPTRRTLELTLTAKGWRISAVRQR